MSTSTAPPTSRDAAQTEINTLNPEITELLTVRDQSQTALRFLQESSDVDADSDDERRVVDISLTISTAQKRIDEKTARVDALYKWLEMTSSQNKK